MWFKNVMCLSRFLFGSLDDEPECTVLGDAEDQEVRETFCAPPSIWFQLQATA